MKILQLDGSSVAVELVESCCTEMTWEVCLSEFFLRSKCDLLPFFLGGMNNV